MGGFEDLPDEVILNLILSRLTVGQMFQVLQINSRVLGLCGCGVLWKQIRDRDFPGSRQLPTLGEDQSYRMLSHKRFEPEEDPKTLHRLNVRIRRFGKLGNTVCYGNYVEYCDYDYDYYINTSLIDPTTGSPYLKVSSRLVGPLKASLPEHDEL